MYNYYLLREIDGMVLIPPFGQPHIRIFQYQFLSFCIGEELELFYASWCSEVRKFIPVMIEDIYILSVFSYEIIRLNLEVMIYFIFF